jgi:hypothetical protein
MSRKTTINGPRGLHIVLDADEVFPGDPGQGTPAMVYKGDACGTYFCALDTGELSCGASVLPLTDSDHAWLTLQEDRVGAWLDQYAPAAE